MRILSFVIWILFVFQTTHPTELMNTNFNLFMITIAKGVSLKNKNHHKSATSATTYYSYLYATNNEHLEVNSCNDHSNISANTEPLSDNQNDKYGKYVFLFTGLLWMLIPRQMLLLLFRKTQKLPLLGSIITFPQFIISARAVGVFFLAIYILKQLST